MWGEVRVWGGAEWEGRREALMDLQKAIDLLPTWGEVRACPGDRGRAGEGGAQALRCLRRAALGAVLSGHHGRRQGGRLQGAVA